jgi:hypothetical protein
MKITLTGPLDVCIGGAACIDGMCICPHGTVVAGKRCVNADKLNKESKEMSSGKQRDACVDLGIICSGGSVCDGGSCQCPEGTLLNGDMCAASNGTGRTKKLFFACTLHLGFLFVHIHNFGLFAQLQSTWAVKIRRLTEITAEFELFEFELNAVVLVNDQTVWSAIVR